MYWWPNDTFYHSFQALNFGIYGRYLWVRILPHLKTARIIYLGYKSKWNFKYQKAKLFFIQCLLYQRATTERTSTVFHLIIFLRLYPRTIMFFSANCVFIYFYSVVLNAVHPSHTQLIGYQQSLKRVWQVLLWVLTGTKILNGYHLLANFFDILMK